MLRYLFPLNTLNVNRDNVNKNVENKSIREIQIPNIGTWFHEFLYPLDYLSKYQKDKKKKKIIILYSIIVKVGKQNRSPTEVV